MSAHVLSNLYAIWGYKMIQCKACRSFYHYFCNEFNKFNNTGAQILYSIHRLTLLFKIAFWCESGKNVSSFPQ